jgi:hypothetical protein
MADGDEEQPQFLTEQQFEKQDKEMSLPPTETGVELTKFILNPQYNKDFTHITKDLAISTLDPQEIQYVNTNLNLIHLLNYIQGQTSWDLLDLIVVVEADIKGFCQVTRSKGGFERLAEITKALKQYNQFEEKKERRWI